MGHALLGVGCFLFVGLGAGRARAASSPKVEGFELLGSVGFGFALEELDRKNQRAEAKNPYGVLLGLNGGYSWASGLRLGLDVQCGFGAYACSSMTGVLPWRTISCFRPGDFGARSILGFGTATCHFISSPRRESH